MTQGSDPYTGSPGIVLRFSFDPAAGNPWLYQEQIYQNGKLVFTMKAEVPETPSFARTSATRNPNTFYAVGWLIGHDGKEIAGSRARSDSASWTVAVEPGQVAP